MDGPRSADEARWPPLRAVADGGPRDAALDDTALDGQLELAGDLARLRDAATLLAARRRLDGLLLALTTHPFDAAAYSGLASYLTGPGRRAVQAFDRANAPARGL